MSINNDKNMYLVSVIVPIYKVENYIVRCANSLLSQTYSNIEFVFVNDCSPDRSLEFLKNVVALYPRLSNKIKIISHEKNRGSSAARNTGIKEASGDFLFFVDADDYVENEAIALLMLKQMEKGADIISGKALRHYKDSEVEMDDLKYNSKEEMVCNLIQHTSEHVLWRRVIRRTLFIDNNVWMKEGTNMAEDWQVITRLAYYAKKVDRINEIVYHYNSTNENSYIYTMYTNKKSLDENLLNQEVESMNIVKDFFWNKEDVYREAVEKMEIRFYYNLLLRSVNVSSYEHYKHFLSLINSLPSDRKKYIGMNNVIKSFFISNYWLMSIHNKMRYNPLYERFKRMLGTRKLMENN